ncbi:MAG TPA: hypothetical protein VNG89_17135, partial [Vicinamibacterales bacterium]|nr:hypothetical protein [Vicinamibacterales bacterium]
MSDEYLYVSPRFDGVSVFATDALAATTERHRVALDAGAMTPTSDPAAALNGSNHVRGVVIGLTTGIPDRRRLDLAAQALARGLRVWLHWPGEQAVECVDREKLSSLERHRYAVVALEKIGRRAHRILKTAQRMTPGLKWIYRGAFPVRRGDLLTFLARRILDARPVPFTRVPEAPSASSSELRCS